MQLKKWKLENSRMVPARFMTSVLLGLSLVSCVESSQKGSNLGVSNEEAQASLDVRLKKTDEVRVHLNSIRNSLRPLEAVLTDAAKGLNAKSPIDGKPADRLRQSVERLRSVLQEAAKGMVEYTADGGWIIDRDVSLPLGRGDYECQTSNIQVQGHRVGKYDELQVSLLDCASADRLNLVSVRVYAERMEVAFFPETLDKLIRPELTIGQCSVEIEKGDARLHCDPIEIKSRNFSAMIDPLDCSSTSQGIDASLRMVVRDRNRKFVAELELEAHPGTQTRVEVRTKE